MLVHMLDLANWMLGDFSTTEVHSVQTILRTRSFNGRDDTASAEHLVIVSLVREGTPGGLRSGPGTPSYMNHVEMQGDAGSVFTSILHYLPTIVYCKEARGHF